MPLYLCTPRLRLGVDQPLPDLRYGGTEGELYNVHEDPRQRRNLWEDTGYARAQSDLIAHLYDHLPRPRHPQLQVEAPA